MNSVLIELRRLALSLLIACNFALIPDNPLRAIDKVVTITLPGLVIFAMALLLASLTATKLLARLVDLSYDRLAEDYGLGDGGANFVVQLARSALQGLVFLHVAEAFPNYAGFTDASAVMSFALTLGLAMALGGLLDDLLFPGETSLALRRKGLSLYRDTFNALCNYHRGLVDSVVRRKFIETWKHKHDADPRLGTEDGITDAILEMIWSLGERFDDYQPPDRAQTSRESMSSRFVGIGIMLEHRGVDKLHDAARQPRAELSRKEAEALSLISDEHPIELVEEPAENSSAAKVGMRKGDRILAINGKTVNGMHIDEAVEKIRGKEGTAVKLRLVRKTESGDKILEVRVVRSAIQSPVVKTRTMPDNISWIKLKNFSSQFCESEMKEALKQASKASGVVLDLRHNLGGNMEYAINIAQMFVTEGKILVVKSRVFNHVETKTYTLTPDKLIVTVTSTNPNAAIKETVSERIAPVIDERIPLVVLVDKHSASASELLAGILQALSRALIVGQPTAGKGVGQFFIWLDKHKRAISVTNFEFLPGGLSIDWVGILPDVELDCPGDQEESGDGDINLDKASSLVRRLAAGDKVPARDAEEAFLRRVELNMKNLEKFEKQLRVRQKQPGNDESIFVLSATNAAA